jgi:hypothetical protein
MHIDRRLGVTLGIVAILILVCFGMLWWPGFISSKAPIPKSVSRVIEKPVFPENIPAIGYFAYVEFPNTSAAAPLEGSAYKEAEENARDRFIKQNPQQRIVDDVQYRYGIVVFSQCACQQGPKNN